MIHSEIELYRIVIHDLFDIKLHAAMKDRREIVQLFKMNCAGQASGTAQTSLRSKSVLLTWSHVVRGMNALKHTVW